MNHLSEEQLILHYYGEADDAEAAEHLAACAECRQAYVALQQVLNTASAMPVPEVREDYGRAVWERLRPALARRRWWQLEMPRRWALVGAAAALAVVAFVAGRYSQRPEPVAQVNPPAQQVRDRVLLVAVGDHLERSQMVLAELVNTRPSGAVEDIQVERQRASDLVSENRLYRQTAVYSGETALASLLEELEPILLEIARGPSEVTSAELEQFRRRVESEGILFKIRVVDSNLKQRERNKNL
jgi:hypothetical protein